jgi:hypothetical protein
VAISLLFIAASLLAGCQESAALILESPGLADRVIKLGKNNTFSLNYTHSVEKTPVIENFTILENGTLLLTATKYRSYGVGLPSLPEEGRLTMADGWFLLEGLHREYRDIRVRVGPEAELSVEYDQKSFPLYQWYPSGSLVIIRKGFLK